VRGERWNKLFSILHFTGINAPICTFLITPVRIAQWSMPVRQLLRNLQMRVAIIAAITSEKREMTIKKVYTAIGH
jgi:hypothetical protein